jgi:hypothetical protein
MEDDLDILDSMQLNTPEDALNLLERLGNGESSGDYNHQEEENGDEQNGEENEVEYDPYEDAGSDPEDEEADQAQAEEPFDNGALHSSAQRNEEEHENQGNAATTTTNDDEAYRAEWNARIHSPDMWPVHSYAYEMMKFDRDNHRRLDLCCQTG